MNKIQVVNLLEKKFGPATKTKAKGRSFYTWDHKTADEIAAVLDSLAAHSRPINYRKQQYDLWGFDGFIGYTWPDDGSFVVS